MVKDVDLTTLRKLISLTMQRRNITVVYGVVTSVVKELTNYKNVDIKQNISKKSGEEKCRK